MLYEVITISIKASNLVLTPTSLVIVSKLINNTGILYFEQILFIIGIAPISGVQKDDLI